MADRPIHLLQYEARGTLSGRQSQVRRIAKRQDLVEGGNGIAWLPGAFSPWSPIYEVGDRLWVREAWRCNGWATDKATIFYHASQPDGYTAMCEQFPVAEKKPLRVTGTWRPSIHMPRWASRITLTVTDVRIERLQDISEQDAIAEGCRSFGPHPGDPIDDATPIGGADDAFRALWTDINGAASWEANPWIVALTFSVEQRNIDARSLPQERS